MINAINANMEFLNTAAEFCKMGAWVCFSICLGAIAVGISRRGRQ